jgi:dTDP-4-amino-4,6-dideoxygalactose transaminase
MIPRTKVNYSFRELLSAIFVGERSHENREKLTARLKEFFQFEHVLLTPSGRAALYYLLKALPQQRVVVPAYTCKAVVEAATLAGKTVIHAEAEPDGFNMDAGMLAPLVDGDTILIATHQFGIPCAIEAMRKLCDERGAFLVEDVAAALGTRIHGRLVGTWGDAAFFSFDSTKLINVPLKAGFLAVRDAALSDRVSRNYDLETTPMTFGRKAALILYGFVFLLLENPILYRIFHKLMFEWRGRYTADGPGLNLTLTAFYTERVPEWQAFLALRQIERLDAIIARRRQIHEAFGRLLKGCPAFLLPPADERGEWACIRYPIRVNGDKLAFYRKATRLGIDFAFSFTFIACPAHMNRAQGLAASVLDLPFYTKLSDRELNETTRILRKLTL